MSEENKVLGAYLEVQAAELEKSAKALARLLRIYDDALREQNFDALERTALLCRMQEAMLRGKQE